MIWHTQPGWIDTDLCLLGQTDVPVYLLSIGNGQYALVEGGICVDAALVWQHLLAQVNPGHIHYWLITHKHFDHCGAAAVLMPRLPNARLLLAPETWLAWQSESCRRLITRLNADLAPAHDTDAHNHSHLCMHLHQLPFELVHPGTCFTTETGKVLEMLPAPGHSSDSIAWYDRDRQRLFAADAVGEYDPDNGSWRPLIFDQAPDYLATLARWKNLPVRQLVPGHGGCLSTSDSQSIMPAIWRDCASFIADYQHLAPNAQRRAADELHQRWRAQSQRFVSAELHLASMRCMLQQVATLNLPSNEDYLNHV